MFDRAIFVSKYEIVLIFTHRPAFTLYSSDGNVLELYEYIMAPAGFRTRSEYERAMEVCDEDTVEINLDEVA